MREIGWFGFFLIVMKEEQELKSLSGLKQCERACPEGHGDPG